MSTHESIVYQPPQVVLDQNLLNFDCSLPLEKRYAPLLMELLPKLIKNASVSVLLKLTRVAVYLRGHQFGITDQTISLTLAHYFPEQVGDGAALTAHKEAQATLDYMPLTPSLMVGDLKTALAASTHHWTGPLVPLALYQAAADSREYQAHWGTLSDTVAEYFNQVDDHLAPLLIFNLLMVTQSILIKTELTSRTLDIARNATRGNEELVFVNMCQSLAPGYQYLLQAKSLLDARAQQFGGKYLTSYPTLTVPQAYLAKKPNTSDQNSQATPASPHQPENPLVVGHYVLDLIKAAIFIATTRLKPKQKKQVKEAYVSVVSALSRGELEKAKELIIELMVSLGDEALFTDKAFNTLALSVEELQGLIAARREELAQAEKDQENAAMKAKHEQSRQMAEARRTQIEANNSPEKLEKARQYAGQVYLALTPLPGNPNNIGVYSVKPNPIERKQKISFYNQHGIYETTISNEKCFTVNVMYLSVDSQGNYVLNNNNTTHWPTLTLIENSTNGQYIRVGTLDEIEVAKRDSQLNSKLTEAVAQLNTQPKGA